MPIIPQLGAPPIQAQLPVSQLVPPQPAAPNPSLGMPYGGGTPGQQLYSNPIQATADTLNILENKKDLEGQRGDINEKGFDELAAKENEAAAEKVQQANDYNALLQDHAQRFDEEHQQTQAAYNEFKKKAGSLQDPSSQFWEDKGQGSRITAALAAFSSGLGSGLTGHGGNSFLDFLHQQIEGNYQAHKQNIEDLYQSAVESGRIEDSTENHNRFMNEAKLKSYDLASAHINHELEAIKNNSTSQLAKVTAQEAQAGLDQEGVKARADLAAVLARQGAAGLAAQRARQKEVRDAFQKAVELHNKDMGENEARIAAAQDVQGMGFNKSELAPVMAGLGITASPRTGEFVFPKSADQGASAEEPHYDDSGKLIVPTKTLTGKRIDQKDIDQQKKELLERSANVDGKPAIFRAKEDADAFKVVPEAERLHSVMVKAWNEGDKGTYDQARSQFIEMAPKLLGYRRGPSEAQAGGIDRTNAEADDRATIAGQLPHFENQFPYLQKTQAFYNSNPTGRTNSPAGIAQHQLAGVRTTLDGIKKELSQNIVSQGPGKKAEPSVEDLAKQFGGKKL